ncbi:MAG: OsmC family protein [Gammaproteobacteria bacterium]|jgi:uncharacterized OsmC-like protein|nr:OsmC family protein [Gammaproteobacteria bacterium]
MTERQVNGIDVRQLLDTAEAIKGNAGIADFRFRARNDWVDGTHNRATVKDFYGALEEDSSRQAMTFEIDEPPVLCGANKGANPVEYLLVALSGCLTTTLVAHAAARGIKLNAIQSRYEGEIDLRGFLGISEDVPVGYKRIRVVFSIDAELSREAKEELVAMAQKYSPVFNTLTGPVPVDVDLE